MKLAIEGMSCGHCVAAVSNALRKVDGVKVEDVTIGEATISVEPEKADPQAVAAAVTDAGYIARVVER